MELTTFIHASAHDLHQLADQSVQMIATSPPYYGLRAYAGEQGVEWPAVTFRLNEWVEPTTIAGCDPNCVHEWGGYRTPGISGGPNPKQDSNRGAHHTGGDAAYCAKCGGWRGGLGMEPNPVAFIGHLILCLREWRRVLRDDGTIWVNLGDSYNGSGKGVDYGNSPKQASNVGANINIPMKLSALKPKDLLGIPWLFAMAARADGWFLRSDIIWAKPNPMPESVTDRPTKAHEYVFLLSKSQRYFFDQEAVREPQDPASLKRMKTGWNGNKQRDYPSGNHNNFDRYMGKTDDEIAALPGRNLRTVWTIATQPTPFAHFATWPEKLVQTMIRAGSSERGACPHCGKAWVRQVERTQYEPEAVEAGVRFVDDSRGDKVRKLSGRDYNASVRVLGETWQPACTCPAHEPVPCVVLDPFNGSGTTGKVAVRLGRAYVGVDISHEYLNGVTSERFGAGVQIGMGM